MRQEDSADNFMFEEFLDLEKPRYNLSKSSQGDLLHNDFLNINYFFEDFKETQKIDIESTFQTQQTISSSSMSISNENFSKETKQNLGLGVPSKNKTSKRNNDRKKKPDYKKNICGYITKIIVKQTSSSEMKTVIKKMCQKQNVDPQDFYSTYKNHQHITGPTHLYGLLTPRLQNLQRQQFVNEINIRIVFVTYYKWFIRHRYLRYIMVEGKMERKDQYLQYKNRELLFLITEEWKSLLFQLKTHIKINKNQKIDGKITNDYIQAKYDQLLEQNSVKFDEKQFKDFHEQMSKQQANVIINPEQIQYEKNQMVKIKQKTQIWQDSMFDDWINEQCWFNNN